jgi:hypothetical protein
MAARMAGDAADLAILLQHVAVLRMKNLQILDF